MNTVTLVTHDATLDDLSMGDYRDMVVELRTSMSLDKLIAELGSQYSKPLWAKVEKGEVAANRNQRNELRRHYRMPLLPPTVAEATATASPDAAVWRIGDAPAEHVIMVTTQEPLTLHVNGSVTLVTQATNTAQNDHVTGVTTPKRPKRYICRPVASAAQNDRRVATGKTWTEIIEAGLNAIENGAHV